ncbi:GGDEF domain-containing protein [Roseomonas sp. CCTCC AB2023176]|uniref:GGDEF domain-containing protein n=1 Tax=Roseomonas sp. CCTCC AB2023176 TaxID=3342640 RepID=UPI0035D7C8FD
MLEAAGAIGMDLADGRHGMGLYAETLAIWGAAIRQDESAQSLLRAVETLSAATATAVERNRCLEEKLAASAGRVARLQARLADMRTEVREDALTGLVNRRGFDAILKRAVAAARGGGTPASLLMLDIDHFKRFNDTYGHPAGDLVLRLVGKVLTQNVKGRDVAARYGGEEFGVILIGAGRHEAETVAEQIRAAIAAQRMSVRRAGPDLGAISVSIGVASCRGGDTAAALVERADRALYRAKQLGRDRVCAEEHAELAWAS